MASEMVDVRAIPRGQRHPYIFPAFSRLGPGESFMLINSHDPHHLRRQFESTFPDSYSWDYLEPCPRQWRIRIGRPHLDEQEHDNG